MQNFAVKTLRVAALALILGPVQASAHAIVVSSKPGAHEVVQGPDITVEIRFNSRIDRGRSKLTLKRPDGSSDVLSLQQSEGDVLRSAVSGLAAGPHALSWQTLSIDGHITHGVVPFEVRP